MGLHKHLNRMRRNTEINPVLDGRIKCKVYIYGTNILLTNQCIKLYRASGKFLCEKHTSLTGVAEFKNLRPGFYICEYLDSKRRVEILSDGISFVYFTASKRSLEKNRDRLTEPKRYLLPDNFFNMF